MKDLNKNVKYTTIGVSKERIKKVFQWLLSNDEGWDAYTSEYLIGKDLEYFFMDSQWFLTTNEGGRYVSIDTLFEETSTNIALVSNDLVDWSVEEFVIEYNGNYYCDVGGNLEPFSYMLELTEEQKEYLNK